MRTLRKRVAAAVVVGVSVLGLLAWFWWLPAMARRRAVRLLEQRLGVAASIGDARLRLRGVVFEAVSLRGQDGGLAIDVAEVGVRAELLSLASEGGRAVRSVQLRGARFDLNVADGGATSLAAVLARLRARFRADPESAGADTGTEAARAVELADGRFRLRDASGELVTGHVDGAYDGEQLSLAGTGTRLGQAPGQVLTLPGWEVRFRGARVAAARVDEPVLVLASGAGQTLRRLSAAWERLAAARAPAGAPVEQADADVPPWLARIADGASLEVHDFTVRRSAGDEGPALLQLHSASAERRGAELHLVGDGEVQGGRTRWDLWVEPGAARGRGSFEARQVPFDLLAPALPELPWWRPELGRVDADLAMHAEASGRIAMEGRAAVSGIALSDPRIAPLPVEDLGFETSGEAAWVPTDRRLELLGIRLRRGDAEVHLAGELQRAGPHYRAALRATLQPTPCDTVIAAVPASLLAELNGFEWRGRMGAQLELDLDSRDLDATRLRVRVANGCEFVAVPAVADVRRFQAPFVHRVEEPDGSVFEMVTGPGTDNWAPLETISPFLVHAVLAHEDAGFFRHAGFSVGAIRDALVRNLREGRYVVGASTITMQLAKNLFLHREKTLARKLQEVILTWWLESALDKTQILELYLNVIEYGPAVYGITNAAAHYFGRAPGELSPAESAFLACVLPNPKRYHASWDRGELSSSMRRRVERFLRHLHARGRIDQEALEFGLSELQHFAFVRPGERPPPRTVRGAAAALPWTLVEDDAQADEWADEEEASLARDDLEDEGLSAVDGG